MKYLSNKNGFLGIDNNVSFKEKVIIVPFGLEKTVSYGGGTKNGPKEIINASHQVELFDEELNKEPYEKIGIKTLKPFPIKKKIMFIKRKISELEDESNQFQNNLEFFSNSSIENPLFKNVSSKIESINEKVEFWKTRLRKIKSV